MLIQYNIDDTRIDRCFCLLKISKKLHQTSSVLVTEHLDEKLATDACQVCKPAWQDRRISKTIVFLLRNTKQNHQLYLSSQLKDNFGSIFSSLEPLSEMLVIRMKNLLLFFFVNSQKCFSRSKSRSLKTLLVQSETLSFIKRKTLTSKSNFCYKSNNFAYAFSQVSPKTFSW